MRMLAKEAAKRKPSSAAPEDHRLPITDVGEWQSECERLTAYLELAYGADGIEHADEEPYDERRTVGDVLKHFDRDADARAKQRAAKQKAAQAAALAATERQAALAAKADAARRKAAAGMIDAVAALEVVRQAARSPPPAPIVHNRPHEAVSMATEEESCTVSRYSRWSVADENRLAAAQTRTDKVKWRRQAQDSTATYHSRRQATTQALREAQWGVGAWAGASRTASCAGAACEGSGEREREREREGSGGGGGTDSSEARPGSTGSKAALALREAHANAARVGAEARRQRDEQREQRKSQQSTFLAQQKQSQDRHGPQQRRRTLEAQREVWEHRVEAVQRIKEQRQAQVVAARGALHEADAARRTAHAKMRRDNQPARVVSRLDRPGLTVEAVDAREFAARQRKEAGVTIKASVQQWDAERRQAVADALSRAHSKSAQVRAIRRKASAVRANVIAMRRDETQLMRSELQHKENQVRSLVSIHVGITRARVQDAYDHRFVAPERARQVATSDWARVGSPRSPSRAVEEGASDTCVEA